MTHDNERMVKRDAIPDPDGTPSLPDDDSPTGATARPRPVPRDVGMRVGRMAELRRRVAEGYYENRAVLEQVARRILEWGER